MNHDAIVTIINEWNTDIEMSSDDAANKIEKLFESSPFWRKVREEFPEHTQSVLIIIEACYINGIFFTPDGACHEPKEWKPLDETNGGK